MAADETKQESDPHVHGILFSKDRAFQCGEALRSLWLVVHSSAPTRCGCLKVTVLWTATSEAYTAAYEELAKQWLQPRAGRDVTIVVRFVKETTLSTQLLDAVSAEAASPYTLLLVDDVLFVRAFDLAAAVAVLQDTDILAVQLRLGSNVMYSHPADAIMDKPRLQVCRTDAAWLKFDCRVGSHDWAYPWDLSATLYRTELVQQTVEAAAKADACHPNRLEVFGATLPAIKKLARFCACPRVPVAVIVTVNRVQDVYKNRIYESDSGSLEQLETARQAGRCLDIASYAQQFMCSAHIPFLHFSHDTPLPTLHAPSMPLVSVLLPVKNGEAYIADAIKCLQAQTITKFEIIVIDDGSTDSTGGIVAALREDDARVLLLSLPASVGVAQALMAGAKAASSPILGRFDADDLCAPNRLERQLLFLQQYPTVDIVGTSVIKAVLHDAAVADVLMPMPQHPLVLAWSMLFFCSLAHPSVCMRSQVLQKTGGYSATHMAAEDYHLWLEALHPVAAERGMVAANIGEPLVTLRKFGDGVSRVRAAAQASESLQAVAAAFERLTTQPISLATARLIVRGSAAVNPAEVALQDVRSAITHIQAAASILIARWKARVDLPALPFADAHAAAEAYVQSDSRNRCSELAMAAFGVWAMMALPLLSLSQTDLSNVLARKQ